MNELVRIVVSDLQHLRGELTPPVDQDKVRRASPILRHLLVEDALGRAWRAAGFKREPQIRARSLTRFAEEHAGAGRWIEFASAGDADHLEPLTWREGDPLQAPRGLRILAAVYTPPGGTVPEALLDHHEPRLCRLSEFLSDPAVIVRGVPVPRRVLLKYVANKLGGAHFDDARDTTAEEQLFSLMDDAVMGDTDKLRMAFYQALAIGQAVLASDDVSTFCERVEGRGQEPG